MRIPDACFIPETQTLLLASRWGPALGSPVRKLAGAVPLSFLQYPDRDLAWETSVSFQTQTGKVYTGRGRPGMTVGTNVIALRSDRKNHSWVGLGCLDKADELHFGARDMGGLCGRLVWSPQAPPQLGRSPGRHHWAWKMPGACCIHSQNLLPCGKKGWGGRGWNGTHLVT